jgi:hypothetical protein
MSLLASMWRVHLEKVVNSLAGSRVFVVESVAVSGGKL